MGIAARPAARAAAFATAGSPVLFDRRLGSGDSLTNPLNIAGGPPYWLDGESDYLVTEVGARQFTRANSEALIASANTSFSVGTDEAWACIWVYHSTLAADQAIYTKRNASGNLEWSIDYDNTSGNYFYRYSYDGTTWAASTDSGFAPSTATWYCIFLHFDGSGTVTISFNAANEDTASYTPASLNTGSSNVYIGFTSTSGLDGRATAAAFGKSPTDSRASIRDYLYNGGLPLLGTEITAAKRTSIGLVEYVDCNLAAGNETGAIAGTTFTDTNTVTSTTGPREDKVADESGNNRHGTITDGSASAMLSTDVPSALASSQDWSLEADGTAYVTVADNAAFSFGNGSSDSPFSIDAWYYWNGSTTGTTTVLTKRADPGNAEYQVVRNAGSDKLSCTIFSAGGTSAYLSITCETTLTAGWNHVCATYDGGGAISGLKLYLNAALGTQTDASAGSYVAMSAGSANLEMFRAASSGSFLTPAGERLARVRLWSDELTSSEVAYAYDGTGTDPGTGNLVGHWLGSNSSFPAGRPADGQPVLLAEDRSGNGVASRQITLAKQPLFSSGVVNSKGGLTFDSVNDFLDLDTTLSLTAMTAFVVVNLSSNVTAATAHKPLIDSQSAGSGSSARAILGLGSVTASLTNERVSFLAYDGTTTRGWGYTGGDIAAGVHLIGVRLDGTTATMWIDGASVSLTASSGGGMNSATAGQRWDNVDRIGADQGQTAFTGDDILAVLPYSSALSDTDAAKVIAWLSNNYGQSWSLS